MLWVDKYRPKTLDQAIVHQDIAQNLKKLVAEQDCPHLLLYGPSGSGKKILIIALLRQVFGPSADKVKVENRTWKVDAGSRTIDIELTTMSSTNHIELNPSDAGFQDRYIVQEIIKEMAKNRPIDTKGKKGYKILVLNEVDKLSREAQHSLRRTMEKYSAYCRLILCCNSSSKVTEAIRSRCLNVRINAPTEDQIVKVLEFIGKKEALQLPSGFAARIAEKSNRSLRRAILSLETCRVQQNSTGSDGYGLLCTFHVVVVLVLNEVDKLSRDAQHSLRRTMEKYSSYCRLILCCNSSSTVTEAIRSQCLNVQINAPTEGQIVKVLEFIGKKEALQLPSGFAPRIAEKSNRSLRRAILSLETCRVQQYPFTGNQAIPPMDWEQYVSEFASDIVKEQSPKRLYQVRQKLYELLLNCIPPEIILKRLLYELLKKLDAELKHEVCHWAAYYEHRMRLGQKAIFHLEAFVAKFMSIYKAFLVEAFG